MARRRLWSGLSPSARNRVRTGAGDERGYLMVALLVAMSVMAIMMGAALPAWRTMAQREKEAELIFRGEQYARAIAFYQRRYGNASPPNLDVLVNEKFLRKKYKDPITGDEFQPIVAGSPIPGDGQQAQAPGTPNPAAGRGRGIDLTPTGRAAAGLAAAAQQTAGGVGRGGIVGVASKSTQRSFRQYNGRDTYNQWVFMGVQQSARAGGAGGPAGLPGTGGRGGRDGRGGLQQPPGGGAQPLGRGAQPPTGGRGVQPAPGRR